MIVFDEGDNVINTAFSKHYSYDLVTKKYNILLLLFPLSRKKDMLRDSSGKLHQPIKMHLPHELW